MSRATRSHIEPVPTIDSAQDLADFADVHGLRIDWHEPDEQLVSAYVYGSRLDNAMGAGWVSDNYADGGEINVILLVDGKREAVLNLANLLAWASAGGRNA